MGRWAERAKAAYAKRRADENNSPPSPSPNGKGGPRRTPAPSTGEGKSVGTLDPPHTIGTGKESIGRCETQVGTKPQRRAQKAYKEQKVPGLSPPDAGYVLVDTADELELLIEDLERTRMVGLDLETTGLCWWKDRIRIISINTEAEQTYVVDAFKVDISPLFPALKDTKIVTHNALFDVLFLKRAGFDPGEYTCTMVLSQILWAGKLKPHSKQNVDHDLASVAKRALGERLDKEEQKADWSRELTAEMLDYAAKDSQVLLPLYRKLTHLIQEAR